MTALLRIVCAASCLAAALVPAAAAARGLEIEDLRNVVTVSAPAISPDGAHVVYVRSRIDWKNDRRDNDLIIVDVRTGGARALTHDRIGVADPKWAPDGSAIAYLAAPERGKPAQLYVLPMNGGDSLKVTDADQGVSTYAWRPDSKAFAFVAQDAAPKRDTPAAKALDAVVITDDDYLTREAAIPQHLWTVDADGKNATRLTSGTWSVVGGSDPVWSRDATKIYYQRQPDALFGHFVKQTTYVHDVAAKTDTDLGWGVDESPLLAPNGDAVGIGVPRHGSLYMTNDLVVRRLDGTALFDSIKGIDRNLHGFKWLPRGDGLVVETADGVRNVAWVLRPNGSAKKIDLGDVDLTSADVANDGGIAFVGQRRDRFPEIYYLAPGAPAPKALSDENSWLSSYDLGKPEAFSYPTDIGMTAVGVLTYPVGYVAGNKYPLVLDIHGGPISTSTWDLAGVEMSMGQVLAKRGYFVFRPNYRGSDNLGDTFLQAIVGDVTSGPGRDNLSAVDALRKTGMIDESRIYVSGWSGGGLQTGWLIGHASFWKAAVAGAGVYDWYEEAVLSDINENFPMVLMNGASLFTKEGAAKYAAESPITFVDAIKTPTLILTDTRDQRVPIPQSFALYQALKQRGIPVTLREFPRYGHFPTDPVGIESVVRSWTGWFDKWR